MPHPEHDTESFLALEMPVYTHLTLSVSSRWYKNPEPNKWTCICEASILDLSGLDDPTPTKGSHYISAQEILDHHPTLQDENRVFAQLMPKVLSHQREQTVKTTNQ